MKHATHELHAMFLNATHVVIENDALLERFNIPKALWYKIRHSWNTRSDQAITGRFDFCMTPKGIKAFEYNIDSQACYLEAGKIQRKWAEHVGCHEGWCSGENLYHRLVEAWKEQEIESTLHLLRDQYPEEIYHSHYMKSAIEAAGIKCKIIDDVNSLSWDNQNHIIDSDGEIIRVVWKTWSWATALNQIRSECDEDPHALERGKPRIQKGASPRLADILFAEDVTVYEPLWCLITNNKAMLAILWQLFPDNPYLLPTEFELTDSLRESGYAIKPLSGVMGSNITIYDHNHQIVASTEGRFEKSHKIYQAYSLLPKINNLYTQISSFTVRGRYSGACARIDTSSIIGENSDLLALRVGNKVP